MESILDYPDLIEAIADSLFLNLDRYDAELQSLFMLDRREDAEYLRSRLENVNNYGGNVTVVGEPGVGKSVFLNWFFQQSDFLTDDNYDKVDLRPNAQDEHLLDVFREEIVRIVSRHLVRLGVSCNQLPPNKDGSHRRYQYVSDKLHRLALPTPRSDPKEFVHYVFVDDVDYMDEKYFVEILNYLRPLLLSRYFCVVIACRIPAYNTIQLHYDNNVAIAFDDSRTIWLDPLPAYAILNKRIETLLGGYPTFRGALENNHALPNLRGIYTAFKNFVVSTLKPGEDVCLFRYPFTPRQHHHMQMLSNGNIREVLDLAAHYLRYMADHKDELTEDTHGGYIVGRSGVITHFTSPETPKDIGIINLHHRKTNQFLSRNDAARRKIRRELIGNSIAVVVLETYKDFQYPGSVTSAVVKIVCEKYGLTEQEFMEARRSLLNLRMLRRRALNARPPIGHEIERHDLDLDVTDKGEYYLTYLIHWDAYIERFGVSNHHKESRSLQTERGIQASLLEFCINIWCTFAQQKSMAAEPLGTTFKISKATFTKMYNSLYRDLLGQLDQTDKLTVRSLSTNDVTRYLVVSLDVIESHGLSRQKAFLFYAEKLKAAAQDWGVPMERRQVLNPEEFDGFVRRHVTMPRLTEV